MAWRLMSTLGEFQTEAPAGAEVIRTFDPRGAGIRVLDGAAASADNRTQRSPSGGTATVRKLPDYEAGRAKNIT